MVAGSVIKWKEWGILSCRFYCSTCRFYSFLVTWSVCRLVTVCFYCQPIIRSSVPVKHCLFIVLLLHESNLSRDMTKPTKWLCAQQRLRSAWASAQSDQSLQNSQAHSEDSDQTGRMPRLIWVFAGHTIILLVLSCHGSFWYLKRFPAFADFLLCFWSWLMIIMREVKHLV